MKRLLVIVIFVTFSAITIKPGICIENNKRLLRELERKIKESKNFASLLENKTKKERTDFIEELQRLKQKAKELEITIAEKKKKFEELQSKEELLKTQINNENEQIQEIQAFIHGFSADILEIFRNNPISLQLNNLDIIEKKLTDQRYNFNFQDFQNLVNALFFVMKKSGTIENFTVDIINHSGKSSKYEVLRIGTFNLYALDKNGKVKVVKISPEYKAIISPVKLPWFKSGHVKRYLSGKSEVLPIDVSGNLAYMNISSRGIYGWFKAGGPIMWPLLVIALAATFISIERWYHMRKLVHLEDDRWKKIIFCVEENAFDECFEICKANQRNPVCKILSRFFPTETANNFVQRLEEAVLVETQNMEKFLPTLTMLAAIAPLLGLLGTVSGIIETFQSIAVFGTGNPRYLSGGISEALITTQFGLMIAVPIIIVHHLLEKWVDGYILEMEERISDLINRLSSSNKGKRNENDNRNNSNHY